MGCFRSPSCFRRVGGAVAASALLASCRGVIDENFGYVAWISPTAASSVDVSVMGTYVTLETPSGTIDRTGVPYSVIVNVSGDLAANDQLTSVLLTSTGGDTVRIRSFDARPATGSTPGAYIARGLHFPYADYTGTAYFQNRSNAGVKDSVRFILQRRYLRRKLTFWQILGGL